MLAATPIRVVAGFGYSDETTRTSERDPRKRVNAPGTRKMIAASPTPAMANIVAGGIRISVAVGGVVKATVKNATTHSGIASLRSSTNNMLYPLQQIHDAEPITLLQRVRRAMFSEPLLAHPA